MEIILIGSSDVFKVELILEQYYLLDSTFNLNTTWVVNMPGDNLKKFLCIIKTRLF